MIVLTKGVDYTVQSETIRQQAIQASRRMGLDISTTLKKDHTEVLITVYGRSE